MNCCITPRHNPAVVLVSFNGGPYLPYCDRCARMTYQTSPAATLMKPLSEYVDDYAIARDAVLLTPEQIIRGMPQPEIEEAAERICRSAYNDRVVYCNEWWCTENRQLTPAEVAIIEGSTWTPACQSCADQRKADASGLHRQVATLDEARKAKYLAQMDRRFAPSASRGTAMSNKARYGPALMIMGASALLFVLGVAAAIASTYPGPEIWFAIFCGIGFFAGFAMLVHEAETPYRAWKDTLSPQDRRRVEVGEAAAAVAATAAIAANIHHRHERSRERVAAEWAAYGQQQQGVTQQAILGQLQQLNAPGPGPADPVAAMHERRMDASTQARNPLTSNGWS